MTLAARAVAWRADGRIILDDVTLVAAPGQVLGLLGPNGSGKSTLLGLLAGLRRATAGVVTLDDAEIGALRRRALARRIGVVAQQADTDGDITVRDIVRLGRTPHRGPLAPWAARDEAAVAAALAETGMSDMRDRLWRTLSGGERQRTQIARALAQAPTELLLDEPTNHLDIRHQLEILALLRRLRVTSVVALHDLNLAAMFCDRLLVLQAGRVVAAGETAGVLTETLIARVFGVRAAVTELDGRPRILLMAG